ncbi:MAG TPA: ribosome maturation factor RimM [Roseiflexaceae bacterium]|nr:ribosome maturation factor RimM [Roseiflexaceae bacterium]HMP42590.1 ribosome maturation factor RimM [Roseiflexaceae bacterium]
MEQPPVNQHELMLIGRIIGVVGLRGGLRMRAITNQLEYLRDHVKTLYLGPQQRPYTLHKLTIPRPGYAVLILDTITSREAADALRGSDVFIHERDTAPLDNDEYFIHELYGLRVVTEQGEEIGQVREVIETGANDVLVVTRRGAAEALIPMIRDVVAELDVPNQRIVIRLIDGLL